MTFGVGSMEPGMHMQAAKIAIFNRVGRLFPTIVVLLLASQTALADDAKKKITFDDQILPILKARCVKCHAGAEPDPTTGARAVPIYQTTSYVFDDVDHAASLFNLQKFGNIYTRLTNPTVSVLEGRIAALEGGTAACCTASGHAAQFLTFLNLMQPGNNLVASSRLYGGSIAQMTHTFPQFGWQVKFVDPREPENFAAAIDEQTRALFIESASNPDGIVADIEAIAQIAHGRGIPLVVDNTLPTPYLCQPLRWGADIVVHSMTKGISGFGVDMGGAVITRKEFFEPLAIFRKDFGSSLAPYPAWRILTFGLSTMGLRVPRQQENAQKIAELLTDEHGKVPGDVPKARKVELLTRANDVARSQGAAITQVMARYSDSRRRILVANTDGTLAGDDQVKTVFSISCVATGDTGMQTGRESVGHTVGFELFGCPDRWLDHWTTPAVSIAGPGTISRSISRGSNFVSPPA